MSFSAKDKNTSSFSAGNKSSSTFRTCLKRGKNPTDYELGELSSLDSIRFLDKEIVFGEVTQNDIAEAEWSSRTKN